MIVGKQYLYTESGIGVKVELVEDKSDSEYKRYVLKSMSPWYERDGSVFDASSATFEVSEARDPGMPFWFLRELDDPSAMALMARWRS